MILLTSNSLVYFDCNCRYAKEKRMSFGSFFVHLKSLSTYHFWRGNHEMCGKSVWYMAALTLHQHSAYPVILLQVVVPNVTVLILCCLVTIEMCIVVVASAGATGPPQSGTNLKRQSSRTSGAKRGVTFKAGLIADKEQEAYYGPLMAIEEVSLWWFDIY